MISGIDLKTQSYITASYRVHWFLKIQSNMLLSIGKTTYILIKAVCLNLHLILNFLMKMIATKKINKVQSLFEIFLPLWQSYSSLNHFTQGVSHYGISSVCRTGAIVHYKRCMYKQYRKTCDSLVGESQGITRVIQQGNYWEDDVVVKPKMSKLTNHTYTFIYF